jgi:hypothetical protein
MADFQYAYILPGAVGLPQGSNLYECVIFKMVQIYR